MSGPIRSAVTTIVGTVNGTTTEVQRTSEMVPMREELFTGGRLQTMADVAAGLQRIQQHTREATQSARSLPFLGGVYMPNVVFSANTAQTFAHGVQGGVTVAFDVFRLRALTSNVACDAVETSQSASTGRITLQPVPSGVGFTCDLYFFPQPSLAG